MATLFFSYSHKDENLRDELEVHLAMLKRQGSLEAWHDRCILGGDDFASEISAHLEAAQIILLLVSPDFLASRYCYDIELARALERHADGSARVIPIILRPCDWQAASFAHLQATPKDAKPVTKWPDRDEAFLDVVKTIRSALPAVRSSAASSPTDRNAIPAVFARPRSSNLRIKKEFSEADKDRYLDEVFEHMALYFENSLIELQARHPEIDGRFKRVDAETFTAVVYRDGKKVASCRIKNRGRGNFIDGISYSHESADQSNSYSETLSVDANEQSLFMRPNLLSGFLSDLPKQLSVEGAAELYWGMLIDSLR